MKYLKKFEVEYTKMIFAKDYLSNGFNHLKNDKFDNINNDLEKLKELKINYKIYYYNDSVFGLLFKILINDYLTNSDEEILKSLSFYPRDLNYKFTFDWKLIDEKDIDIIISSCKYNL